MVKELDQYGRDGLAVLTRYIGLTSWPERGSDHAGLITARWARDDRVIALDYDHQEGWWNVTVDGKLVIGNFFTSVEAAWATAAMLAADLAIPLVTVSGEDVKS